MTRNQIVIEDLIELINEHGGIDSFSQAMSQLMDRAMAIERADVLGAEPYQRTDTRCGYANGFKPKTLHTRLGPVPLKVPQVRGDVSFYPSALTKGLQTERALTLAVAEMYIQGVSTRRVEPILEKLVGHGISSSSVSKATAELDETLQAWRNRPLSAQPTPYLILDARYEKARIDGIVRDVAVLIAIGVQKEGEHVTAINLDFAPPDDDGCPVPTTKKRDALRVKAAVFIDASYEADLMAGAEVSYVVARESRDTYSESLGGQRNLRVFDISPYVDPDNPASGLLPMIDDGPFNEGAASRHIIAFNFRLQWLGNGSGSPVGAPSHYVTA